MLITSENYIDQRAKLMRQVEEIETSLESAFDNALDSASSKYDEIDAQISQITKYEIENELPLTFDEIADDSDGDVVVTLTIGRVWFIAICVVTISAIAWFAFFSE